jgi:hypothetical protein
VSAAQPRMPPPDRPVGPSPFAANKPNIIFSLIYMTAVFIWLGAGDSLIGGRWFAVHLFTLGVLTNLILSFSHHFALTVTRGNQAVHPLWHGVTNSGILMVLIGLPQANRAIMVTGATLVTVSVFAAYLRLRALRLKAIGARFSWLVRLYERAHIAFIYGAVLGALVGANVVSGPFWGSVRLAHLHANVLGWAGLALAATLVFFGPTITHTKIVAGADTRAARQLKYGATALTGAIVLMAATGINGTPGQVLRIGAAVLLAVFAMTITQVCVPVFWAAYHARHSAQRPLVLTLTVFFPLVVWADVLVVATASWRFLDVLGAGTFTGVLGPAILATLLYVAPMLRANSTHGRDLLRRRLLILARTRAVAVTLGALLVSVGASRVAIALPLSAIGFGLLAVVFSATVLLTLAPVNVKPQQAARS